MKKFLIVISVICITLNISAQIQIKDSDIQLQIEKLSHELKHLNSDNEKAKREIKELYKIVESQNILIDSISIIANTNSTKIDDASKIIDQNINRINSDMSNANKELTSAINEKSIFAGIVGLFAIVITIVTYLYYRKETNKHIHSVDSFAKKIEELNTEQIQLKDGILNNGTKYIDTIEETITKLFNNEKEVKDETLDHSLAIAVANEIARIQQNLNHMDPTVKGVSQLKNRSKAIITTLNSKQYDIPDLIGKTYHEGDNMVATMELNEELEEGASRIKRVLKPQVSYMGKIIQHAEVVVEYNE